LCSYKTFLTRLDKIHFGKWDCKNIKNPEMTLITATERSNRCKKVEFRPKIKNPETMSRAVLAMLKIIPTFAPHFPKGAFCTEGKANNNFNKPFNFC